MAVTAVVFDIGNVLIEWNPERFYDRAIGREARERLFAEVDLHAMNLAVDRGAPFHSTISAEAARHPEWSEAIRMWHDNWLDIASPRIDGAVTLLEALVARGTNIYALSNIGVETFAIAEVHYPFLTRFKRAFVSGQLRMAKPEPEIYEVVERGIDEDVGAILFTDDRAENIDAAAARGWQTHLFDGADGLADRLIAEGLLTPAEAARPSLSKEHR